MRTRTCHLKLYCIHMPTRLQSHTHIQLHFTIITKHSAIDFILEISPQNRYLLNRRRARLDLKHDHHVAPAGGGGGIDGIYYVPDFVTKEEGRLLEKAARSGGDGGGGPEWKDLFKRRLQIHGGTPHPSGMVEDELPPFLRQGVKKCFKQCIFGTEQ